MLSIRFPDILVHVDGFLKITIGLDYVHIEFYE